MSLRETLETVERLTGNKPEELETIPLPLGGDLVWRWFCMMSAKRQAGMAPCPIADSEIIAFFKKHKIAPEPWQLIAIDRLDNIALESAKDK